MEEEKNNGFKNFCEVESSGEEMTEDCLGVCSPSSGSTEADAVHFPTLTPATPADENAQIFLGVAGNTRIIKNYVIIRKPKVKSIRNKKLQRMIEYKFSLPERYSPIRMIGEGAYGYVISAFDNKTGQKVAVKVISLTENDCGKEVYRSRRFHKCILRELILLKHFKGHPNIIGLIDVYVMFKNGVVMPARKCGNFKLHFYDMIYVVTDLMESDLYKMIINESTVSEKDIKKIIYNSLKGINYIHSSGVFHRDVKPQNILIDSKRRCKICDFGLSRGLNFNCKMSMYYVVTRYYRSPEILCKFDTCNVESDLWSLGCCLYELISGLKGASRILFKGNSWVNQLEKIIEIRGSPNVDDIFGIPSSKRFIKSLGTHQKINLERRVNLGSGRMKEKISQECFDLLDRMLDYNPQRRITAEEALKHEYFRELYEEDLRRDETREFLVKKCKPFDTRIDESIPLEVLRDMLYNEVMDWEKKYNNFDENSKVIICNNTVKLEEKSEKNQN